MKLTPRPVRQRIGRVKSDSLIKIPQSQLEIVSGDVDSGPALVAVDQTGIQFDDFRQVGQGFFVVTVRESSLRTLEIRRNLLLIQFDS